MSSEEIKQIFTVLKEARYMCMEGGEYESALNKYDHVIRLIKSVTGKSMVPFADKLQRLRDVCRGEVRILRDYVSEVKKINPTPIGKGDGSSAVAVDDPDVWPPPTPLQPAKSKVSNPWIKPQGAKQVVVNRGVSADDQNNRLEQLRKERDNAVISRKRYVPFSSVVLEDHLGVLAMLCLVQPLLLSLEGVHKQ